MGAKSNFYVDDQCLLNHANYSFSLDCGAIVAAYPEKILIGFCENNKQGQLEFSKKKTIIVPNSSFYEFVKVIKRGLDALKNKSNEAFEEVIYKHSNTHSLIGKYQMWQQEMTFSLFYIWRHAADKHFLNQIAMGLRDPINTSKLENPDIQPLKLGIFNLKLEDLDIFSVNLDTIIPYTY